MEMRELTCTVKQIDGVKLPTREDGEPLLKCNYEWPKFESLEEFAEQKCEDYAAAMKVVNAGSALDPKSAISDKLTSVYQAQRAAGLSEVEAADVALEAAREFAESYKHTTATERRESTPYQKLLRMIQQTNPTLSSDQQRELANQMAGAMNVEIPAL